MPEHYNEENHAHFLTFGTHHHVPLFNISSLCSLFLKQLNLSRHQLGFELWAYVVMPDHVHLMVLPREGTTVSQILSSIKRGFAWQGLQFLREHSPDVLLKLERRQRGKITHHIWQAGGGHDRNIFGGEALLKSMDYIHNNPVRKGLVSLPENWEWSSAGFWLSDRRGVVVPDIPPWWRDQIS